MTQHENIEFNDNEPSIERCPHDKENPYALISRALIRDNSLSPQCRHMLIYLLSMDEKKWKINPKQLVAYYKPHWGRDKIYDWIDEAIEAGYMKKEITPNVNHPNLRGKIKYFISEEPKFKKCFRHTDLQGVEGKDPENTYIKNNNHTSSEEEVLNKEKSSSRKRDDDDDFKFSKEEWSEIKKQYSKEQLMEAEKRTLEFCKCKKGDTQKRYFKKVLESFKVDKKTPQTSIPSNENVEINRQAAFDFKAINRWSELSIKETYVQATNFSGKDISLKIDPQDFMFSLQNLFDSLKNKQDYEDHYYD